MWGVAQVGVVPTNILGGDITPAQSMSCPCSNPRKVGLNVAECLSL